MLLQWQLTQIKNYNRRLHWMERSDGRENHDDDEEKAPRSGKENGEKI